MFKFVGFLLLALCLTGSFGEDAEQITTADTFGNLSDFTSSKPEPEETTLEPVNTTKATPSSETNATTAPETTKSEPVTTPANDTTLAPITTTTTAATPPRNTTTPEPTTTSSSPVTPTSLPSPETGDWNIYDSKLNITCIRAKFAVQFKVFYYGEEYEHNLSPNATSGKSSCRVPDLNNTQILILEDAGYVLTFVFENDMSSSSVHHMTLLIPSGEAFTTNETQFEVKLGRSYLCNSKSNIQIDNATLAFSNIHLQAFMHNEKDFSTDEQCSADFSTNNIVPIAVAIALGALVIIVLIVYLVKRRQSQKKDYQSM